MMSKSKPENYTAGEVARSILDRARAVTASEIWDLDRRFPIVMDRAQGAHVFDADGREYIDFTSCSGAAPLGAGHAAVRSAMIAEMERSGGILPGPISTLRVELAERLASIFPCAERSIFFRTGSCATSAAVRLARVFTGRRLILTSGFHGWHDWQLQYRPHLALADRDHETLDFGYDLNQLEDQLSTRDQVAAIIFTPEVSVYPEQYARELAEIVQRRGVLLIIDEVMSGFRYSWGGYHKATGVRPDIVTLSKGLANGTALSSVSGRADVLQAADRTYLGNTFQRETTPFAAALATVDSMQDGQQLDRIVAVGEQLMAGLDAAFIDAGVNAWISGSPSMFDMIFEDPDLGVNFCHGMWERGFLMQYGGRFMPSAAVGDKDVALALEAVRGALAAAVTSAAADDGSRRRVRDERSYVSAAVSFARENFGATESSVRQWAGSAKASQ